MFFALSFNAKAQSYCSSDGGSGFYYHISDVIFGAINNHSGPDNGYADFTHLSTDVLPGDIETIQLQASSYTWTKHRWRVWIDWNNDGDFNDSGEKVLQRKSFYGIYAQIFVPNNVAPGPKRMRISQNANGYVGPCAHYYYGEVEDYTVNVISHACIASAGTLTPDVTAACASGNTTISATPNGNIHVPNGYQVLYVLTEGSGLVIQDVGSSPTFTVAQSGNYTIHTLVYDPNTLDLSGVVPGVTTGFDVNGLLIQGGGTICASLDVAGAHVQVANPMAGTMSGGTDVCSSGNANLSATANGDASVPAGYSQAYVLTSGSGLVIEQLGATPDFTVSNGGMYTIHSFVYPTGLDLSVVVPGVTTGFDVNGLLVQGGGALCASLDVAGTVFNVANPMAGTMSGGTDVCSSGNANLSATANGDAIVPAGYTQAYVLTSGSGLVIEQLGTSPDFTVSNTGMYTIHSFVYPTGLDLSVVVPGVTTGFDVNGLLLQGGGALCASLDVAGTEFDVLNANDPNCGSCAANTGTLTASASNECLYYGSAQISATPNGNLVVPNGYSTLYVLTEGSGLVIQDVNNAPNFYVNAGGNYTIHTLVYDPNTLDLNIVVFGTTTGFDVNSLLIQGGGSICASLDVAGAPVQVDAPYAGYLYAQPVINCIGNGSVNVSAAVFGNDVVPAGYSTVYVLTRGQGLVIEGASATPNFTVTQTGLYRIHTLVYDPATLDLNSVVPGVTTGFDVNNLLVQGGGSICASLDIHGAPLLVLNNWWCQWLGLGGRSNEITVDEFFDKPLDEVSQADLRILEENSPVTAKLYPVPTSDILNIDVSAVTSLETEITIVDMTGRTIVNTRREAVDASGRVIQINVNGLEQGQYIVQIQAGGVLSTESFVKID